MFELKKVKVKDQGLSIEYIGDINGKGLHPVAEKCSLPIHSDLRESLDKMRSILAATTGLNWPMRLLNTDLLTTKSEEKAAETIMPKMTEAYANMVSCIDVTGYALSGDDSVGVVITGTLTLKGRTIALNSPRIIFGHDTLGIEGQAEMMIDECNHEVEAYLFHGKVGAVTVPDLFTNVPDEDEENVPEEELEEQDEPQEQAEEPKTKGRKGKLKVA